MAVPEPIHAHALDNIRYIRDAMSRAGEFTAIPGWGGVLMGASALAAAAVAGPPDNSMRWIAIWFAEAAIAVTIALVGMTLKSRRSGTPLWTSSSPRASAKVKPSGPAASGLSWATRNRAAPSR